MVKGIIFALSANFVWGLIFVIPQLMEGFTSFEVALGRYFFFGLISIILLCKALIGKTCYYPKAIWMRALGYSFVISFGFYPFIVLSLRCASPAICAIILGISPITIAFYGSWKHHAKDFRALYFPSLLILIGVVCINAPHFSDEFPLTFFVGLLSGLLALISWSWFAVANAEFLKCHPELRPSHWSTLLGTSIFFWVLVFGAGFAMLYADAAEIQKYTTLTPKLVTFLIGSCVLGFLCSWVGSYLWNKASFYLPFSLIGQLTVFETIFGLLFVYLYDLNTPPLSEFIGIVILLTAVIYGIRHSFKTEIQAKNSLADAKSIP